ncbi:MAG: SGNH/GDSL hydrolase family protein [Geminicoccaceae bacterium]
MIATNSIVRIAAIGALATASLSALAQEDPKRIFVFGDSLTWGWTPVEPIVPTVRHAHEDRWTTALAEALGDGYELVVNGLSGRTTNIDDPTDAKLNGAEMFPALLAAHEPLDLVIIMLGTNDTKTYLQRTPFEIGLGAGHLINMVHEAPGWDWTDYPAPQVLLISPPPLGQEIDPLAAEIFEGSLEKSRALPQVYEAIAAAAGESFFDAGSVISTDGVDGIHFTAETNQTLGEAVADEVKTIFKQ